MGPCIARWAPVRLRGRAHLDEVSQALVIISPVGPTLADLNKQVSFRVSTNDEPLCKSRMSVRYGAKEPAVVWIYWWMACYLKSVMPYVCLRRIE